MEILEKDLKKYRGKEIYIVSVDSKNVSTESYLYTTKKEAKKMYIHLEEINLDKNFSTSLSKCMVEEDLSLTWC